MSAERMLFAPESPSALAVMSDICREAGCAIVTDPAAPCDLAIAWDTNTYRARVRWLEALADRISVWNLGCRDIGKARVDRAFREAFGYSSLVDPLVHRGPCVSKSNLNGAHDGRIVGCPVVRVEPDRVYQRLVGNERDGTVEDIRTPVFGDDIPFVYLKYRPVENRFDQFETAVAVTETAAVFTPDERATLVRFARALRMEYGELDVLRDGGDGRLYVVDANPTPFGPPNLLAPEERARAIARLAAAFDRLRRAPAGRRPRATGAAASRRVAPADRPIASNGTAAPALSVVVVTRNEGRLLHETVEQLCATLPAPNEVVVVDDGSDDGSTDGLRDRHPRVQVIRSSGLGVARARNLGARRSTGRVLVFADAHLSIPPGWWEPLVDAVGDPRVGGAAPAIANSERSSERGYGLRFTGFDLDVEWLPRLGDEPYPVPLMPWCFGAMRREVFDATGGFDAGMIQWGSIDNEMSVRLWSLGFELRVVPAVEIAHLFRDTRPYPIEWAPVVHNRLRLALVHFDLEHIARVVGALGSQPDFPAAVARAATGNVPARRSEMDARRTRDTGWLFRDLA